MKIEETLCGVQIEGSFDDVCEETENIVKEYGGGINEWRPEKDDNIEDIKERTARNESINSNGFITRELKKVEEFIYKELMMKFNDIYYCGNRFDAVLKEENDRYLIRIESRVEDIKDELKNKVN